MSTFKEALLKILTESIHNPPAIHQQHNQSFSPAFVNYVKHAENGVRKGFDVVTGRWHPHASVEGGAATIAYGHKLQPSEHFKGGITEDEATRLLNSDLQLARNKANKEVDSIYGIGIFHNLPIAHQEMLTDMVFNLGSLKSFPKFTRAVLRNDTNTIAREYKRYSNGRELTQRNQQFYNRYIAASNQNNNPTV